MARAWKNLGYLRTSKAETKLAFDLSSTLPRAERLSIEGAYDESIGERDKAIEVYKSHLEFLSRRNWRPASLWWKRKSAPRNSKTPKPTSMPCASYPPRAWRRCRLISTKARVAQGEGDFKHEIEITHRTLETRSGARRSHAGSRHARHGIAPAGNARRSERRTKGLRTGAGYLRRDWRSRRCFQGG